MQEQIWLFSDAFLSLQKCDMNQVSLVFCTVLFLKSSAKTRTHNQLPPPFSQIISMLFHKVQQLLLQQYISQEFQRATFLGKWPKSNNFKQINTYQIFFFSSSLNAQIALQLLHHISQHRKIAFPVVWWQIAKTVGERLIENM